jgi:hypothetical protein
MLLEDRFFELYDTYTQQSDDGSVVNGRGLFERMHRMLGNDADTDILTPLTAIPGVLINPYEALARFVPYLENSLGLTLLISDSIADRRKVVSFAIRLYQIKGTIRSYEVVFKLLGFDSVTITELFDNDTWDSPLTLDDDDRRFDNTCSPCSAYTLDLTGTFPLTDDLRRRVFVALRFVEPINARLRDITYNGNSFYFELLTFENTEGRLFVNNDNAPNHGAYMDSQGNLYVTGPNAANYSIGPDGDIIYTI